MNNEEILETLEITGKLMELHGENPFKTKALTTAAYRLRKLRFDFNGRSTEELAAMEGVGKSIALKIATLRDTGQLPELKELLGKTPPGVIQMLGVKGLGPKKVKQLWDELGLESVADLLYACNENRLTSLKGFGEKTQSQVKQSIEFSISNQNRFHYASLEKPVQALVEAISLEAGNAVALVGEMARKCEVISAVELLLTSPLQSDVSAFERMIPLPVKYHYCEPSAFARNEVALSAAEAHLSQIGFSELPEGKYQDGAAVYEALGLQYVEPELREGLGEVALARAKSIPRLLEMKDLKGILHNHSTYSDGVHTLREMADYCQELGYGYLGICDHSRAAFYAQGLSVERVLQQQEEIDAINSSMKDFRILKGIESDILSDGSLDYPEEILKTFDLVVASVHSNLKMSEEKATARLIRAIENPYTHILGHPSGRLLLGRSGYPLDYRKVIDACAANKVSIELNAHPYRLDIDWRWIPYCMEKGVLISVNPDAHHREGFHDMHYGVCAARKGMLTAAGCLNALPLEGLLKVLKK